MDRRKAIKFIGTGTGIAIAAPAVLVQLACASTKQLVKWTSTAIAVLTDISPILAQMGAGQIVDLIAQALPIAEKLKKAFSENDGVTAGQLLANLIDPQTGLISQIADAAGLLGDDARKQIVLGSLAIAQVALRLISTQIESDVPAAMAATASKSQPMATAAIKAAAAPDKLKEAFEATRF